MNGSAERSDQAEGGTLHSSGERPPSVCGIVSRQRAFQLPSLHGPSERWNHLLKCSLAASEVDVRERDGFFSRLPLPDIWSTKPVFVRLAAHRLVMDAAHVTSSETVQEDCVGQA